MQPAGKFVKKGKEETGFLFKKKPIITFDNFFSGDVIMDWCGRRRCGLVGLIMTCRRDRFPSELDNKYLLSAREAVNKVNKVARFNIPSVAVKKVEGNETEGYAS